eukprot:CAMPEP_0196805742 /NCGR_PEP_ID=MMETSP1362-20130617/5563_1 /TAXON_ID=163516 /ORGANISM="Leptocylindrus danicus, Strain CCMP1856" /LENGTH=91 /DNA_ID=CAMNT_0042178851 /DNA_START=215 /DNA_END=487 /DNA_ORIENTATION=-
MVSRQLDPATVECSSVHSSRERWLEGTIARGGSSSTAAAAAIGIHENNNNDNSNNADDNDANDDDHNHRRMRTCCHWCRVHRVMDDMRQES